MPVALQLHVSPRGRLELPELVLALGPAAEGVTGAGTLEALYGHVWALAWDRTRDPLVLLRVDAGELLEVTPLEALPELTKPARHISLAFDASARPMIAWQGVAGVYVRQWDAFGSTYVVRGPFAGADPCLIADTVPRGTAGGSDVHLYYLAEDRMSVHARLERDTYGVEYDVAELDPSTSGASWYLDQAVMLEYRVRLELATDAIYDKTLPKPEQDLERLRLESDLYPIGGSDPLALSVTARGAYDRTTETGAAADPLALTLGARGHYETMIALESLVEPLALTLGARGRYETMIALESLVEAVAVTLSARGKYDEMIAVQTDENAVGLTLAARGEYRVA